MVDQLIGVPNISQAEPEEDPLLVGEAAVTVLEVPGGGGCLQCKAGAHFPPGRSLRASYMLHTLRELLLDFTLAAAAESLVGALTKRQLGRLREVR